MYGETKRQSENKGRRKGRNTASRDLNPILKKRKCVSKFWFIKNFVPKFLPLFLSASTLLSDSAHGSILV
jgi:hypothetical protein